MVKSIEDKISEWEFDEFTYSKFKHFKYFSKMKYDLELFGNEIDPYDCDVKAYQNLLIFAFIKENLLPGLRILDIGGGYSRILNFFKNDYECWSLDREQDNHAEKNTANINKVKGVIGNFNKELPGDYFDFVFSLSSLSHVPQDNHKYFISVLQDINRISKVNSHNFHCFDIFIRPDYIWANNLLIYFFQNSNSLNEFIHFDKIRKDPKVFVMSEKFYENNWKNYTELSYEDFGKILSYNIVWKKESNQEIFGQKMKNEIYRKRLPIYTITKPPDYLKKNQAYVFHHIIKCGGTSVQGILNNWFQLEWDYRTFNTKNPYLFLKSESMFNKFKFNIENFTNDICLMSHFNTENSYLHIRYPEILKNIDKFRIFAFVREPFELATSLYYYRLEREEIKNDKLREFLFYTVNLLAYQFPCNKINYKEVLENYFFIGIVERMQESFDTLADLIGKKRIKLPTENKSKKDSQLDELKNDTTFLKKYRERNSVDYVIYDYCREKYLKGK